MNENLPAFALAVQGVVCFAAATGYWKVHGDSKFVKAPLEEMDILRTKILRALSVSLVGKLEPILTLPTTIEIHKIFDPRGDYVSQPKIASIGAENLLNAVRDIVKSDMQYWQSLRELDQASACGSYCLKQLRQVILIILIASGIFALAATADKYAIHRFDATWVHVAGLIVNLFLIIVASSAAVRITLAVNTFETIKEKNVDLP